MFYNILLCFDAWLARSIRLILCCHFSFPLPGHTLILFAWTSQSQLFSWQQSGLTTYNTKAKVITNNIVCLGREMDLVAPRKDKLPQDDVINYSTFVSLAQRTRISRFIFVRDIEQTTHQLSAFVICFGNYIVAKSKGFRGTIQKSISTQPFLLTPVSPN